MRSTKLVPFLRIYWFAIIIVIMMSRLTLTPWSYSFSDGRPSQVHNPLKFHQSAGNRNRRPCTLRYLLIILLNFTKNSLLLRSKFLVCILNWKISSWRLNTSSQDVCCCGSGTTMRVLRCLGSISANFLL